MLDVMKTVWPIVAAFAAGGACGACIGYIVAAIAGARVMEADDNALWRNINQSPQPFSAPIAPEPAFNNRPPRRAERAAPKGKVVILPMMTRRPVLTVVRD